MGVCFAQRFAKITTHGTATVFLKLFKFYEILEYPHFHNTYYYYLLDRCIKLWN